ncbi:hypothetical protein AAG570_000482 [Ranatra chinensis]|uniref:Uncharacterized protein n=1 Tax=Ranatra chinensis TaxID=642074 RepID=A0ABD0YX91_9HEMI
MADTEVSGTFLTEDVSYRRNKLTPYNTTPRPNWTYGLELWGSAKKSNIEGIQAFRSKKKEVFEDVSDVCDGDIDDGRSYGGDCPVGGGGGGYLAIESGRVQQEYEQLSHQQHQMAHQQQLHIQSRVDCPPDQDEFEAFAKSIACQMRQLPLELAVELQADIQSIISQKRLIVLRHQSGYSRQIEGQYQH